MTKLTLFDPSWAVALNPPRIVGPFVPDTVEVMKPPKEIRMSRRDDPDTSREAAEMIPPIDPNVDRRDVPRLSRQCALIVERLRRGPATNVELAEFALKYTSRLSDLRAAGYEIGCERLGGGLTMYTLKREP